MLCYYYVVYIFQFYICSGVQNCFYLWYSPLSVFIFGSKLTDSVLCVTVAAKRASYAHMSIIRCTS